MGIRIPMWESCVYGMGIEIHFPLPAIAEYLKSEN